jgi:hypothetical protein
MQTATKVLVAVLALGGVLGAQTTSTDTTTTTTTTTTRRAAPKKKREPVETPQMRMQKQIDELRNNMQTQIDSLKQQLTDRDAQLQAAKMQADQAATAAQAAAAQANQAAQAAESNTAATATLQGAVTDLKTTTVAVQAQSTELKKEVEEPLVIHYKGVSLTPGGFLAAETVYRQRGIGGDINTQFTGVPYSGQSAGQLSEFNMTGRQSRLSLLAEGKTDSLTMRGYYETDFLSSGVTSNDNQSNSYTLRQRQAWAQAQTLGGWVFTGGQMWSLLTENRSGITNRTEATPLTIDPQYNVGFVWTRQYGMRVVKNLGDHAWIGVSAEAAETTNVGCHNYSGPSVMPPDTSTPCTNILYQQAGNTGGLYNSLANYSYNEVPDFIAKAVFEPGFGHWEVEGILSSFRDRYFPNANASTPSASGATNKTTEGGGIGASARFSAIPKKVDIGFKALLGAGIERYGSSTLPEVTVKPGGALEPLRGGSALATLEMHPMERWDVYANFGIDYVQRVTYYDAFNLPYGYGVPDQNTTGCQIEVLPVPSGNGGGNVPGSPAHCTADNRATGEGTVGYWYRFYKGPKGTLQQGMQFSYLERATWQGTGGSPKATDFMWFTSFRYYLP